MIINTLQILLIHYVMLSMGQGKEKGIIDGLLVDYPTYSGPSFLNRLLQYMPIIFHTL